MVMAGLGLIVTAVTVRQSRRPPASEHRRLLGDATAELAELVSRQWNHEAAVRGLTQPAPLRVRWASTGRAVAAPAAEILGPGWTAGRATRLKLHGDVTQVAAALRRLPARRLVVIGAPGAGKTSLAVMLVRELLAEHRPGEAVPVLLSFSMWQPDQQSLEEWLVKQISGAYPALTSVEHFGDGAVHRLLTAGLIIPVLDGLDEVAPDQFPLAVTRLNRYLSEDRPVVVTCRAAEYQEIIGQVGAVLARAAVVELEPVSHTEAAGYLPAGQGDQGRLRWEPVTRHLVRHPDGPLARVFSTPLMVHLARVVYRERVTSPADLLRFTDPAAIEDHLLRGYVPALYAAHGDDTAEPVTRRPCPPEKAERWLAFLAGHLTRARVREITWWQLVNAVPLTLTRQALAGVALVAFLIQAVVLGGRISSGGVVGTMLVAVLLGAPVGIVMGLADGQPSRVRLRPWAFLEGFAIGNGFALVCVPIVLLTSAFAATPVEALEAAVLSQAVLCLVGGVLVGTVAFLVEGIGTTADPTRPAGSRASLRDDRRALLLTTTAAILAVAVIGTVPAAGFHVPGVLVLGAQMAFTLGPVIGLASGAGAAWLRFTYARLWLVTHGLAPWRVLDFLDDAHDRGVLRRIGPAYQFRHARLQNSLAAPARDAA